MRVHISTYGCTLNQADSDIMVASLPPRHSLAESERCCDVVVINTCTVKGATENRILERLKGLVSSGKPFVVAGCFSASVPRVRKFFPGAPILSPSALGRIADAVDDAAAGRATHYESKEPKGSPPKLLTAPICRIPINDGCVSQCHFCQTRLARPFLRSYPPRTVLGWVDDAVRMGAREIQLTSQDSGAYGLDIKSGLLPLLAAVSDTRRSGAPEGGFLVRLGMINPEHAKRMLPGIIQALLSPRFYRFLHVPVQTGSEKVCREMNRSHSVADFREIVSALRNAVPDVSVATDIIVGYPTETEADFEETLALLRDTEPETINISKFSPRPGTAAKALKQLPNGEVKRRSEVASALAREITAKRRRAYVGRRMRVLLTENERDFKGRAPNYLQVVVKDFPGKAGEFADVDIFDANHGSLFGRAASGGAKKTARGKGPIMMVER